MVGNRAGKIVEGFDHRFAFGLAPGKKLAVLDHAAFRVEFVRHLERLFVNQAPVFEKELGVAEVEDGQLGVGRLALVLIAEAAAEADRRSLRHGALRHSPAGNVHLVDALVADLAVAEVPHPMPVIRHEVVAVRLHRRRTGPEIVVETLGRLLRCLKPMLRRGLLA